MPKAQSRDTIIKTAIALAGGVAQSADDGARARTQSVVCGMLATLSLNSKARRVITEELSMETPNDKVERDPAFNLGARWALGIPLGGVGAVIESLLAKGRRNLDDILAEEVN